MMITSLLVVYVRERTAEGVDIKASLPHSKNASTLASLWKGSIYSFHITDLTNPPAICVSQSLQQLQ